VRESLRQVGFRSAVDLAATYAGDGRDLAPWLKHAQINRDHNLRLQYLAGMGLNNGAAPFIYNDMLRYRRFPERLLAGSDPGMAALRKLLAASAP
jgi:spermidine synthase